ncbi:MAG: LytR/AlgR family response regulator transcription factor [Lachnospiraceae bacterium]
MIKIAIVDDEQIEREHLSYYFERIQQNIKEEIIIKTFITGEEFLFKMNQDFDIICMDIEMEGRDGIEIAKEIRKKDQDVMIIFVTNLAKMAIKGYEVQAFDFILKPINFYSFSMKIQNAMAIINNRKKRNIIINTANGMVKVSTNDIFYIEVEGHYVYYYSKKGTFKQKASLKELEKELEEVSFKRCNNCYLVNLKYVDCVQKDEVEINGKWLKISRPRKKMFLQSLANYMGGITT